MPVKAAGDDGTEHEADSEGAIKEADAQITQMKFLNGIDADEYVIDPIKKGDDELEQKGDG